MNLQTEIHKSLLKNYLIFKGRKGFNVFEYIDLAGNRVALSFRQDAFDLQVGHVLVMVKKDNLWLLTNHPKRGFEFPGGKIERGELPEEASIRETYEETGVILTNVKQFASYVVYDEQPFHKAVFTGTIKEIKDKPLSSETNGLLWLSDEEFSQEQQLSFHMKDEGVKKLRQWVNESC